MGDRHDSGLLDASILVDEYINIRLKATRPLIYKPGGRIKAINLNTRLVSHNAPWQPECLFTVDDSHSFKIAKFKGSFDWHCHPNTDETFYCVSGQFKIEMNTNAKTPEQAAQAGPSETILLKPGDIFCVRKGLQHRPIGDPEAGVLMFEKIGTVNTGDNNASTKTVRVDESNK